MHVQYIPAWPPRKLLMISDPSRWDRSMLPLEATSTVSRSSRSTNISFFWTLWEHRQQKVITKRTIASYGIPMYINRLLFPLHLTHHTTNWSTPTNTTKCSLAKGHLGISKIKASWSIHVHVAYTWEEFAIWHSNAVLELTASFTWEEFAIWHFRWNSVYDATLIQYSHTYAYMYVRTLIAHRWKFFVFNFRHLSNWRKIFNGKNFPIYGMAS